MAVDSLAPHGQKQETPGWRDLHPRLTPEGRAAIHGNNADYGDRVAQRAYELYLARGASDGQDFDDWLAAERELATSRAGDTDE